MSRLISRRVRSRDQETESTNSRIMQRGSVTYSKVPSRAIREGQQWPGTRPVRGKDVSPELVQELDDKYQRPQVGRWVTLDGLPSGARWRMFGVRHVDEFHLAGGVTDEGVASPSDAVVTHEVFDLRTGSWSTAAVLPAGAMAGTSGAWRGEWFLAGGNSGLDGGDDTDSMVDDLRIYDFEADSWSAGTSMPARRDRTAGDMLDGKLHVVGGRAPGGGWNAGDGPSASNYIYDVSAGSWSSGAALPVALDSAGGFAYGGYLYILGGRDATGSQVATLYRHDPAADEWLTLAAMPEALESPDFGVVDGVLWVYGGTDAAGDALDTVYAYHFVDDTWRTAASVKDKPTLAGAFYDANNLISDGRVYSFGGRDAEFGGGVAAAEALTVADHSHERGYDAHVTRRGGAAGDGGFDPDESLDYFTMVDADGVTWTVEMGTDGVLTTASFTSRTTETGDTRVTESGDIRILEG